MGRTNIISRYEAASVEEAFQKAQDVARECCGSNPYNGTFSTICGIHNRPINGVNSNRMAKDGIEKGFAAIREQQVRDVKNEYCPEYAIAYDCGISYYVRKEVKRVKRGKVDAKTLIRWQVLRNSEMVKAFEKQADAEKHAADLVAKMLRRGEKPVPVTVVKRPMLVSGNDVASEYRIETTRYDRKPRAKDGAVDTAIHQYVLGGWAHT